MSRLVVVESLKNAKSARHEWDVVIDAEHPERGLDPSVLLNQVGLVAAALAAEAAGAPVEVASVERLEVLAAVVGGERLIVTAAIEPVRDGQWPVSLVARRRRGAPGAVVIAGVLRFSREAPRELAEDTARLARVQHGAAPMQTQFKAKVQGDDVVLSGNLVAWVHASALVSARGHAGGPVTFVELEDVTVLAPVAQGESLTLQCSVVEALGRALTVWCVVRSDEHGRDVLRASLSLRAPLPRPAGRGP